MASRPMRLYYEDENGNHLPDHDGEPPAGARYQVAQFPAQLTTTYVDLDYRGAGSPVIARAEVGYAPGLVLAMVRPTLPERIKQIIRFGSKAPTYDYETAVLRAALACERCGNAMAYRYGLSWGYREGSEAWTRCPTSCQLCRPQ